ncbi:MAG: hypothetical protein RLZZ371_2600 [Pseudomonadota bacterium]|jgi:Ni/Co efflux regulator RcnB
MKSRQLKPFLLATLWGVSAFTLAGKPEWVSQAGQHQAPATLPASQEVRIGAYFQDSQRQAVARYYGHLQAKGRCPPGLAKKHNGCLPPGQAKKWALGQPLPASLIQYPVPGGVITQIGQAPAGYKYVRVANDILLVALGTMMVVDAIEDLMKP